MKSMLPENEETLICAIQNTGPLIIDGKKWYLDEDSHLHYQTIPDLTGTQLGLGIEEPFPCTSLFGTAHE